MWEAFRKETEDLDEWVFYCGDFLQTFPAPPKDAPVVPIILRTRYVGSFDMMLDEFEKIEVRCAYIFPHPLQLSLCLARSKQLLFWIEEAEEKQLRAGRAVPLVLRQAKRSSQNLWLCL